MIYWYHVVVCVSWPTFHAWVTMVRKKWLSPYYSTYWCYIHQTCTNFLQIFHISVTKTQNGYSQAPVMVQITIMSSYIKKYPVYCKRANVLAVKDFSAKLKPPQSFYKFDNTWGWRTQFIDKCAQIQQKRCENTCVLHDLLFISYFILESPFINS